MMPTCDQIICSLDSALIPLSLLAVTSEDEDDGTLRHFVIKREFAEGAIMMAMLKFPGGALPAPGGPAPLVYRCACRQNRPFVQAW